MIPSEYLERMSQSNWKSQKEEIATNESTKGYLESRYKTIETLDFQY